SCELHGQAQDARIRLPNDARPRHRVARGQGGTRIESRMDESTEPHDLMTKCTVTGFVLAAALFVSACRDEYRIGDYVWVEWEGRDYPAYIVDRRDKARFRVHFDG